MERGIHGQDSDDNMPETGRGPSFEGVDGALVAPLDFKSSGRQ